jgi:hypothetical protein
MRVIIAASGLRKDSDHSFGALFRARGWETLHAENLTEVQELVSRSLPTVLVVWMTEGDPDIWLPLIRDT